MKRMGSSALVCQTKYKVKQKATAILKSYEVVPPVSSRLPSLLSSPPSSPVSTGMKCKHHFRVSMMSILPASYPSNRFSLQPRPTIGFPNDHNHQIPSYRDNPSQLNPRSVTAAAQTTTAATSDPSGTTVATSDLSTTIAATQTLDPPHPRFIVPIQT
jgi:hypothetical protein